LQPHGQKTPETWTGGSKTLTPGKVTFISSTQIQMNIVTGTTADNWTVRMTNPSIADILETVVPLETQEIQKLLGGPTDHVSLENGISVVMNEEGPITS